MAKKSSKLSIRINAECARELEKFLAVYNYPYKIDYQTEEMAIITGNAATIGTCHGFYDGYIAGILRMVIK